MEGEKPRRETSSPDSESDEDVPVSAASPTLVTQPSLQADHGGHGIPSLAGESQTLLVQSQSSAPDSHGAGQSSKPSLPLRQALGSPYQKLGSPHSLEAGGVFRPPLGRGLLTLVSSSPVRTPRTPYGSQGSDFKVPRGHPALGPESTPPTARAKKTPRTLLMTPSPGSKGLLTPQSCRGLLTPKGRVHNPFERGIDHLHHPLHFSPNMFTVHSTPASDDGKSFTWSIDNIAHLQPADIPEIPPHQEWHHTPDQETEERAQRAIAYYFANHHIVPSPWSEDKKQPAKSAATSKSGSLPSSDFEGSIHVNLASASSDRAAVRESACQTALTLPKNFDLQNVLGEYMTYAEPEEASGQESLSSSSLRRKLFDADSSSNFAPTEGDLFVDEPLPSNKPVTPEWERLTTPKKTPSSVHFSSSPIRTPCSHQSPTDKEVFSPHVSPIKHYSVKARSRLGKVLVFEDLADSPVAKGPGALASPFLSPIHSDPLEPSRSKDFHYRRRPEDLCASPELSPIATGASPKELPKAMSPELSPILAQGRRTQRSSGPPQDLSPIPLLDPFGFDQDMSGDFHIPSLPASPNLVEMQSVHRLSAPGVGRAALVESMSVSNTPKAILARISRCSSEAGGTFVLPQTRPSLSPGQGDHADGGMAQDAQVPVAMTTRATGFGSQESSISEPDTSGDQAPLPNSLTQDTGYQTSSLQMTTHTNLTGQFGSLPFRNDSSQDSAIGGDGDREEREKDRELKRQVSALPQSFLGQYSSFPLIPDYSQDEMGFEGREKEEGPQLGMPAFADGGTEAERMDTSSPAPPGSTREICLTGVRISRERTGPFVLDLKPSGDHPGSSATTSREKQIPPLLFGNPQENVPFMLPLPRDKGRQLRSSVSDSRIMSKPPADPAVDFRMPNRPASASGGRMDTDDVTSLTQLWNPPTEPYSPRSAGTSETEHLSSRRSSEGFSDSELQLHGDTSSGDDLMERAKTAIALANNLYIPSPEIRQPVPKFLDPSQTPPPLRLAATRRKVAVMRQMSQTSEPTESQLASDKFKEILRQANRDLEDLDQFLPRPGKKS